MRAPEKRRRRVRRRAAEDVERRGLALASGGDPVFDADVLAAEAVGIIRDIACGVNAGRAGAEKLVDDDAVIDREAADLRQLRIRTDADAGDDEVGQQRLAGRETDAIAFERRDGGAEAQAHAVLLVEAENE